MVALTKPSMEHLSLLRPPALVPCIPLIDLSKPDSKTHIVKACEDFGFFKLINHGIPTDLFTRLESEAVKFFSLPLSEKQSAGPPADPFGYGNNRIGRHGDVGWVEYLLFTLNPDHLHYHFFPVFGPDPDTFRCAVNEYVSAVRELTCQVVELMANGLRIEQDTFSRLLKDERSDSCFRLNYYPPCPEEDLNVPAAARLKKMNNLVGFGEHTDPQIVSVLRSNNTPGLEISLKDGNWVSVPPDQNSFFFIVGDSLQVMTNGRFQSVRHRVLTNRLKSRISMIYFGGPPMSQKIGPLPSLTQGDDETSLYKEFTWFDYKSSAYNSRLADNRLVLFENIAAS